MSRHTLGLLLTVLIRNARGGCAEGFCYRILKEAGEESIERPLALFRNIRYGATGSYRNALWVSEMTVRDKEKARGRLSLGLTSKKCMQV